MAILEKLLLSTIIMIGIFILYVIRLLYMEIGMPTTRWSSTNGHACRLLKRMAKDKQIKIPFWMLLFITPTEDIYGYTILKGFIAISRGVIAKDRTVKNNTIIRRILGHELAHIRNGEGFRKRTRKKDETILVTMLSETRADIEGKNIADLTSEEVQEALFIEKESITDKGTYDNGYLPYDVRIEITCNNEQFNEQVILYVLNKYFERYGIENIQEKNRYWEVAKKYYGEYIISKTYESALPLPEKTQDK